MNPRGDSVKRLYDVVKNAIRISEEFRKKNGSRSPRIRDVWSLQFSIDEKDVLELFVVAAELYRLSDDCVELISSIEGLDKTLFVTPIIKIRNAFSHRNLDLSFEKVESQINGQTLYGLEFCVERVKRENYEVELKVKDIDDIKKDIEALIKSVTDSELPDELKVFILHCSSDIQRSLHLYKINGINGIEWTLESCIGAVMRRYEDIRVHKDNKAIMKFFALISKIDLAISMAENTQSLITGVMTLLENR